MRSLRLVSYSNALDNELQKPVPIEIGTGDSLAVFEEAVAEAAALLRGRVGFALAFGETEIIRQGDAAMGGGRRQSGIGLAIAAR